MLCLEVLLNEHLMARAGGRETAVLMVELSGGREGPIGLTVHGWSKTNDCHLMWVDESIESAAVVTFNIIEESFADTEPSVMKGMTPIITKRQDLTMDVEINGRHQCTAQIGNLESLATWIEWAKDASDFSLHVKSLAGGHDEYRAEREWCAVKLGVGDRVVVRLWSDN